VHGHGGGAMGVVEVVNCGKRRSLGVQEWNRKKKLLKMFTRDTPRK
jgi:hypothetical protein